VRTRNFGDALGFIFNIKFYINGNTGVVPKPVDR